MKHIEEYITEAVARRTTGKYKYIEDLRRGDRVRLKKLVELPGYPKFKMLQGCPVIGESNIVIWDSMQVHLGKTVTIEDVDVEHHTVTDRECMYIWPIEALEGF